MTLAAEGFTDSYLTGGQAPGSRHPVRLPCWAARPRRGRPRLHPQVGAIASLAGCPTRRLVGRARRRFAGCRGQGCAGFRTNDDAVVDATTHSRRPHGATALGASPARRLAERGAGPSARPHRRAPWSDVRGRSQQNTIRVFLTRVGTAALAPSTRGFDQVGDARPGSPLRHELSSRGPYRYDDERPRATIHRRWSPRTAARHDARQPSAPRTRGRSSAVDRPADGTLLSTVEAVDRVARAMRSRLPVLADGWQPLEHDHHHSSPRSVVLANAQPSVVISGARSMPSGKRASRARGRGR